jgi:hypothetical protein
MRRQVGKLRKFIGGLGPRQRGHTQVADLLDRTVAKSGE